MTSEPWWLTLENKQRIQNLKGANICTGKMKVLVQDKVISELATMADSQVSSKRKR